jgi:hypothetical protein
MMLMRWPLWLLQALHQAVVIRLAFVRDWEKNCVLKEALVLVMRFSPAVAAAAVRIAAQAAAVVTAL